MTDPAISPPPLTGWGALTSWTFPPGVVALLLLLLVLYVVSVRRLRGRGDAWSGRRVAAWVSGLAIIAVAETSAAQVYSTALYSAGVVQHMTLQMVAPAFLALAAPMTLALRTLPRRARRVVLTVVHSPPARVISHPAVAFALSAISLFVFYYTPLVDATLHHPWLDALSHVHFVAVGFLFYWSILGIDPVPHRPPFPFRFLLVVGMAPMHVLVGLPIMLSDRSYALDYFLALGRNTPADVVTDLNTGGALLWAFGDVSAIVLIVGFVTAWHRSDDREARRLDRALDRIHGTAPTMTPWWLEARGDSGEESSGRGHRASEGGRAGGPISSDIADRN